MGIFTDYPKPSPIDRTVAKRMQKELDEKLAVVDAPVEEINAETEETENS